MPKLKPTHIFVSEEEDKAITSAAMLDPDAMPLTDEQWEAARPTVRMGRPKAETTKVFTAIRLDADLVSTFKATGKGWQTRVNAALREYIAEHPIKSWSSNDYKQAT